MKPVKLEKFFHVSGDVMIELRPVQLSSLRRMNREKKQTIAVLTKKEKAIKKK